MTLEIRPVETHEEYRAVERLQREVWGYQGEGIVPDHMLITVQENGGLVLGAFERQSGSQGERMVGFALGFAGLGPDGRLKHASHMVGVAPAYQNQNVGYQIKLVQRERVLAQGINLITWTFDPLESRNAYLNFHKLGATCRTYLRELYGPMRDALNVSLPSDRFQVDWHIASPHVARRLGGAAGETLATLRAQGVPVLNPVPAADLPRLPETVLPIEGGQVLIQVPAQFQRIKSADLALARAWREHTRALFETAFALGYTAADVLYADGISCYLLRQGWSAEEADNAS